MLFVAGLGAITSMQIGGRLADALGARRVVLTGLPLLIAGVLVVGLAPSYPYLVVGAVLLGLGNGALDVAQNALGVQVEQARRRPVLSLFHAFFRWVTSSAPVRCWPWQRSSDSPVLPSCCR